MPPPSRKYQHPDAPNERGLMVSQLDVIHAGWVLKKKRKKMQGYAKRYLILTRQGLLTYSLSPDKRTRDSIEIPHASVTSSARHGTLHIDSGASVFHLKALNAKDFEAWRAHLRSFIPERDLSAAQNVYVGANDGTKLQAIDFRPVFAQSEALRKLIEQAQQKCGVLQEKEQGGLLSSLGNISIMPQANADVTAASLAALLEQIAAEHMNLHYALDSKIPKMPAGGDGTMKSLRSNNGQYGGNASRMSFASFHTVPGEEASFFEADDAGEKSDEGEALGDEEEEDDDDESGAEDESKPPSPQRTRSGNLATATAAAAASSAAPSSSAVSTASTAVVKRRTELPAKVSGDEVSLFSILKKNVGKDLSTVSFPVSFNCPLSLLQASAEEFEYAPELLERAARSEDWVERICLVGAFAVSGYNCTKLRASRKPFNPLLGETFECVREDKNLRFLAEKVVHQPPVVAYYAEGKGWRSNGWSAVKNKFWGKSLELIPEGACRVELDDGDAFVLQKPSSFMRNLLAGNKYLEHVGELVVRNAVTGEKLVVEFKEGTMWGGAASRNHVTGTVYDAKGRRVTELKGKWSESLSRQRDAENYQVLWEAAPMPARADEYYGFTYFAMSLNEVTSDLEGVLPASDTRLRPDQRAFEEGDVERAEELKAKLENAQRERRKAGKSPSPRWFHRVPPKQHADASNGGGAGAAANEAAAGAGAAATAEGGGGAAAAAAAGSGAVVRDDWAYGGERGDEYFKLRAKATAEGAKAWGSEPKLW